MIPTVADVMLLPVVQAGDPEVAAGRVGLDRSVRWVHVSELPDIAALLKGGELILTTGIALSGSDEQLARWVRELDDAAAAGIVIELGRRFTSLPPAMVRAADDVGLPVIALHREVAFVSLTEVVHRQIVNAHYELLEFADDAHRAFTALSIEGASVQEILDRTAAMTGQPVVLEDLAHRAVAYAAGPLAPAELLLDWETRSRMVPPADETAVSSGPEGWIVTGVGPRFERWGRLVLPRPAPGNPQLPMLLERAAEALALVRLIERDRSSLAQQAHGGLLSDLLRGRSADAAELRARAGALGFPTAAAAYVGLCVDSPGSADVDPLMRERRDRTLTEVVGTASQSLELPVLASSLQPGRVLLLAGMRATGSSDPVIDQLVAAIAADLHSRGWTDPHVVGVGRDVTSFTDCGMSLADARHVVDVVSATGERRPRPYYRAGDLRLRGVLSSMRDDPRWLGFVEAQLGPLLAHDVRHRSHLEQTLRQFLEAGGNKSRLARTSHVSRPALYARLATIERLLDADLTDPETCTSLHVALLLRTLRA